MTTEERIAIVEQRMADQKATLHQIQLDLEKLVALANMGKGALNLFLKMGTIVAGAVAIVWAVFDKFHKVAP